VKNRFQNPPFKCNLRRYNADGSGARDVDELEMVFKVMSIPKTRVAVARLFRQHSGGADEVDVKTFEKIMAAAGGGANWRPGVDDGKTKGGEGGEVDDGNNDDDDDEMDVHGRVGTFHHVILQ
jgi:hypothetical protein